MVLGAFRGWVRIVRGGAGVRASQLIRGVRPTKEGTAMALRVVAVVLALAMAGGICAHAQLIDRERAILARTPEFAFYSSECLPGRGYRQRGEGGAPSSGGATRPRD